MESDAIVPKLARWYAGEKDRYEFRQGRNPYRTWITEIFLQQTQIAAGREKLKVFLKRFPDVATLAAGPIEDVLAAFRGMGYYSRARNMHRAALEIMAAHAGKVPVSYNDLTRITGIGPYTAALIASIHGGEKILATDANQVRVLSRLFRIAEPQASAKFKAAAQRQGLEFFKGELSPGDVNEALMQWGQIICKKRPLCDRCFAATECAAYRSDEVHSFPQKAARAEASEILWLMLVYRRGSKYQVFENMEKFPFLKGEWMFPAVIAPNPLKQRPGESHPGNLCLPEEISAAFIKKNLVKAQSLPVDFRHAITRYKIFVKLMIVREPQAAGRLFTPAELKQKCHSSLMQKALRRLDKLEFD